MAQKKTPTKKPAAKADNQHTEETTLDARKATSRRKVGLPGVVASDATAVAALGKNQVSDFVNFLRQQGVVGLAVGLAVGTAAGAAVKEIVNDFINPIVGFLIGGLDLTKLTWTIVKNRPNGTGGLIISWGAILSALITLLATAFVVYIIVHGAKLDRLDKPKS